ncbi:MAG: hypothetical protein V4773_11925 [Verrucomicrobiota bacterium]
MARRKKTPDVYVASDGTSYPLEEAQHDYPVMCFKSDCRKAVVSDPEQCLIAKGAARDKAVLGAYIGSGKDAYIIFRGKRGKPAHAVHFTINAKASRIRDQFDKSKAGSTATIILKAPTDGRTLAHRRKLNKDRAERIAAGDHTPRSTGKKYVTRVMKLGLPHRPRAKIKDNVVSLFDNHDEAAA